MKSRRKHELQTNELADAIGKMIATAKPHFNAIALAAAAVVVVLVVLVIVPAIRRGTEEGVAAATFNAAQTEGDAAKLRKFLEDHAGAPQAPAARLLLAERLLSEAVRGPVPGETNPNPTPPDRLLAEAGEGFGKVAASSEALKPMAEVGLALVTIQQGDLDKGRAALEAVVAKWPQSVAAEKARLHIEALAGYEPVKFSDEPLEEPKPPEPPAAKPAEAQEGEPKPAPAAPGPGPTPGDAKPPETPAPAGAEGEKKPDAKPVG